MSAAPQIEFPIHTREDFYELERFSNLRHEFHAGAIIPRWGNSLRHARIVGETTSILGNLLDERPCFVVPSEQIIRVEDADMDAYPAVVVYCENAEFDWQFERTLLEPLVLVEVLSPSTQNIDLGSKRRNYFRLPTLTDYLVFWRDKIRLDQFMRVPNEAEPQVRRHLNRHSLVRLDELNIEFRLGQCYRFFDDLPEGIE